MTKKRKTSQSNLSLASELRQLQEKVRHLFDRYKIEKRDLEATNKQLQQRVEQLERQLAHTENERQSALIAREGDQSRQQREQELLIINLLRKMGEDRPHILDMLEMLDEPDSSFTSRDVLNELKRWIRDISGERPSRFPTEEEAPGGQIALTPDELTDLERGFDVGHERPFADGQKLAVFKVVRRGWRLGTYVLHPARLSVFVEETSVGGEET